MIFILLKSTSTLISAGWLAGRAQMAQWLSGSVARSGSTIAVQ